MHVHLLQHQLQVSFNNAYRFTPGKERQHRFTPCAAAGESARLTTLCEWSTHLVVVCESQGQVLLALPTGCPVAHLLLQCAALAAAGGQAAWASALEAA